MVKIREFELDFIEELPMQERQRDIRIKNHRTKEEADHGRRLKQGRVRTKVDWNG